MSLRYTLGFLVACSRLSLLVKARGIDDWGPLGRPAWWTPAAELSLVFDWTSHFSETRGGATVEASRSSASPVFSLLGVNNTGAGAITVTDSDVDKAAVSVAASAASSSSSSSSFSETSNAASAAAQAQEALALRGSTNTSEVIRSGVRGKQPLATRSWFSFLRFSLSFAFVIKCLCMMSNVLFQVSPFPLVRGWKEQGDTGDTDPAPFVTVAYGGCQWCFYGLFAFAVTHKNGFLVLVYSNICGAALGIYYVFMFERLCADKVMRPKLLMYLQIAGAMTLLQTCAIICRPSEQALFFAGIISSACSIVGVFSLCLTIPLVIQTQCSKSMPLPLLLASYASAVLWVTCGVLLWDPWITFPNFCCCLILTFALALVWMYPADGSESPLIFSKNPGVSTPQVPGDRKPLSASCPSLCPTQMLKKISECAAPSQYGSTCVGETGGTPMPPDRVINTIN